MKVLLLERTIILCFLCNSIVISLGMYTTGSRKYIRGIVFALIFTVLDILVLYAGSDFLLILLIAVSIVLSYYIFTSKRLKGLYTIIVIFIIAAGLYSMIPIRHKVFRTIVIGLVSLLICGFISQLFINNYVKRTIASIKIENCSFDALIDTGIICDNSPIIIISQLNPNVDIEMINKYKAIDMPFTTITGSDKQKAYIAPIVKVVVKRKSNVFFDTVVVVTEADLPCRAIISAMGLI